MSRIKAVFIDRDGTINYERNYVHKIEEFELIPGSLDALKLLVQHRIKIFIITNQAGIAKGHYSEKQFHVLTDFMINSFENAGIRVEGVLYCPHHPAGVIPEYTRKCLCRKPNTRLIEDVIKGYRFEIDEMALIGDKNSDIEAGERLGLTTYLVLTGYGRQEKRDTSATYIKPDLLSATKHVIMN